MMRPIARTGLRALLAAWLVCSALPLQAAPQDALYAMEQLRYRGCGQHAGIRTPLRTDARLDAAALQWSRGARLHGALVRSGYRADRTMGLHVSGDAAAIRAAIAQQLCAALTDPAYDQTGILQRGPELWIVVAAPFSAPGPQDSARVALRVLRLVNEARDRGASCGRRRYPPVTALRLDVRLSRAAQAHADDMLRRSYFDHRGSDGSTPAQRVARTAYRYRRVGENIALGPESADEAVRGWLASPGHCENIMDPRYADLGVAFAVSRSGPPRIVWVEDFGQPR